MCGSATFATLVSSTSMNVASVTVSAIIHGFTIGRCQVVSAVRAVELTYFTVTFGSTDMPSFKYWSLSSPGSKTIFTGMRCTTFT